MWDESGAAGSSCAERATHVHCSPVRRAAVHIQVNDVNEFAPVFRESEYRASVTEGKIYDNILQVEATDQDCSPQYSQICNYQISSARTPFAIDRNGERAGAGGGGWGGSSCLFPCSASERCVICV